MSETSHVEILVLAPGGIGNLSQAVAASRCGAIGVVDLEGVRDPNLVWPELARVENAVESGLGFRLRVDQALAWSEALERLLAAYQQVILSCPDSGDLTQAIEDQAAGGRHVLVEVVSLAEARAAEAAGAQGIIAKGNEAGGRVGEQTTFILLQRIVNEVTIPVLAQGGVGLHTIAGMWAGGARGVVLDWQLSLMRESRLPSTLQDRIRHLDGRESQCLGQTLDDRYRLLMPGGPRALEELESVEHRIARREASWAEKRAQWRTEVRARLSEDVGTGAVALSQDVAFAARFAETYSGTHAFLEALRTNLRTHLESARRCRPLAPGRGSAEIMGTRYPIVQGPMSRVSDTPAFAGAVAEAGAMPVLAVAAMAPDELEPMLKETAERLDGRPFGVGLLGFLDRKYLDPQLELVKKYPPAVAVVAGGTPAQAQALSKSGIRAYIHVPSIRLLSHYIQQGARSFIFEGRECGGHIGPFASTVLWENAVDCLLRETTDDQANEFDIWFAGGIHDEVSASVVAAVAAPLAERGIRVGMLLATAYLFTEEAVAASAIGDVFQQQLVDADQTDILDSGGGYEVRSAPSPFSTTFADEKMRLREAGKSAEEVRDALELLNLGRLRIASKGLAFNVESLKDPSLPQVLDVPPEGQRRDGCFMAGQVVALHDDLTTVADLHRALSEGSSRRLEDLPEPADAGAPDLDVQKAGSPACDVAIIGMGCVFPGAADLRAYWDNILNEVFAITEVPPERWDAARYFDPNQETRDKIYSKWGGFLDPIVFDPTKFSIPPRSVASIDPLQLFPLEVVRQTLVDAGYDARPFDRERTAVIFGVSGGMGELGMMYGVRSALPLLYDEPAEELLDQLPEWTEDSFPGVLANVVAGRIANLFDLGGPNFTVDAACGSGLAAIYAGVREITTGTCDSAIVGASDVMQNPFGFLCFSKTRALSPTGRPRPFDAGADGITIAEGVASVFLKRRDLAERDGDRIYAVIRGVGASSDGKGASMTAPQSVGQSRAFKRAYHQAGFSPATVELIEAHGTGTTLGDGVEARSIHALLEDHRAAQQSCAVGSVKSMIGHTKGCAGIAGIIKTALSLYHKVLPPTMGVEEPSPPQCWGAESPIYINSKARPWLNSEHPRRAGVDAFGFGGSNFHAVVEEYRDPTASTPECPLDSWPCELVTLSAPSTDELQGKLNRWIPALAKQPAVALRDLASALVGAAGSTDSEPARLALVAESGTDLLAKLKIAAEHLAAGRASVRDPRGVFLEAKPPHSDGKIAFLFPGQASQRPNMLRELAVVFPAFRSGFETADAVIGTRLPKRLSHYVYPPALFAEGSDEQRMAELTATDVAQPALAAVELGVARVLEEIGIRPDMVAGHSAGEYPALCMAGAISDQAMFDLLIERGRSMARAVGDNPGTMMAVMADWDRIAPAIEDMEGVYPANLNSPTQTILAGQPDTLKEVARRLDGIRCTPIQVSCAFHSPFVAPAAVAFRATLDRWAFQGPSIPIFSNLTAEPFPQEDERIRTMLCDHVEQPVRWADEVRAMYDAGARIFVEVGPGTVLTRLQDDILGERPFTAVACDAKAANHALPPLLRALAELYAAGAPVNARPLLDRRRIRPVDPVTLTYQETEDHSPASWMLAPDQAWPMGGERRVLRRVPATPAAQPPAPMTPSAASAPSPSEPASTTGSLGEMQREALIRYQKLMAQMVEQQKEVMLAFLGGTAPGVGNATGASIPAPMVPPLVPAPTPEPAVTAPAPVAPAPVTAPSAVPSPTNHERILVDLVAERTGYPPEMLDLDLDMEADLGIDSIKRVEILTAFGKTLPPGAEDMMEEAGTAKTLREVLQLLASRAAVAPEPADDVSTPTPSSGVPTASDMTRILVALVAERTGYPPEMLDLDLDMEADLGIDSIKRVEILTAFGKSLPDAPAALLEEASSTRTLREVVEATIAAFSIGSDDRSPSSDPAPPNPAPESAPAPVASTVPPSIEVLTATLVDLVAERTGYPPEMLDTDLDLEADLGIDSIKRVEILTAFAKALPHTPEQLSDDAGKARTLRDLVDAVRAQLQKPSTAENPPPDPETVPGVQRYLVKLKQSPLAKPSAIQIPDGAILITDDGKGYAAAVSEEIQALGGTTVVLSHDPQATQDQPPTRCNLGDGEQVDRLIGALRKEHGKIGGILHLLPLRDAPPFEDLTLDQWQALLAAEIKSLFYLLHYASADLGDGGFRWVMACSSLSGTPHPGQLPTPAFPWRGGLMGMIKSVGIEWPHALCRIVDIDNSSVEAFTNRFRDELGYADGDHEVYYRHDQRWVPEIAGAPLKRRQETAAGIDRDSVILAVGGARGITAEVLRELASRYQPVLVLSGRSPWPAAEPETTAGVDSPTELRRILFAAEQARGKKPKPIEIEQACRRILADREMLATQASLEALGATVSYVQADVSEPSEVARLLDHVQTHHGRLDGVINGAGIIEDKLVQDKSPESFDRVFDVKVKSVYALATLLKQDSLKFLVLFSSVAGWFGNRGQVDYAAANEVLNRTAMYLCGQWNRRVVAVNWGPWAKAGMVTEGVKAQFSAQGLEMVEPAAGSRYLMDELCLGNQDDAMVIAVGRTDR